MHLGMQGQWHRYGVPNTHCRDPDGVPDPWLQPRYGCWGHFGIESIHGSMQCVPVLLNKLFKKTHFIINLFWKLTTLERAYTHLPKDIEVLQWSLLHAPPALVACRLPSPLIHSVLNHVLSYLSAHLFLVSISTHTCSAEGLEFRKTLSLLTRRRKCF